MASEESPKSNGGENDGSSREPLSPAKAKRLQKVFQHASKQMSQDSFDYATTLLMQCVLGDPGNLGYVQSYIGNLQKKYNNNRKGANFVLQLKERGSKNAVKKALGGERWMEVIRNGLKVLTVNPWDVPTLMAMATASEKMEDDEVELFYLKSALQAKPNDPDVNLQCAQALRVRRQYDQAIACLHRAEKARPDDEEVQKLISQCAVEKTIDRGGLGKGDPSKAKAAEEDDGSSQNLSREQQIEQAIAQNPKEMSHYFELAQIHIDDERFEKAEKVLAKAYEASGNDPDIRERWEDVQLRSLRLQVVKAEEEAQSSGNEEDKAEVAKAKKALILKEVEVYRNRVERYPNNLEFKFKLAQRYQLAGKYDEAIKQFQTARTDPRRKGLCLLALGQCFQQIKQERLAMQHYEQAIEELPDRDAENKKLALYLAGKMALHLGGLESAERHLNTLAALDFSYRDVRELLDKIAEMRENDDSS